MASQSGLWLAVILCVPSAVQSCVLGRDVGETADLLVCMGTEPGPEPSHLTWTQKCPLRRSKSFLGRLSHQSVRKPFLAYCLTVSHALCADFASTAQWDCCGLTGAGSQAPTQLFAQHHPTVGLGKNRRNKSKKTQNQGREIAYQAELQAKKAGTSCVQHGAAPARPPKGHLCSLPRTTGTQWLIDAFCFNYMQCIEDSFVPPWACFSQLN